MPTFNSFWNLELDENEEKRIVHVHHHLSQSTVHKNERSYIWDGSSEWCLCGHHVTDHKQLKYSISKTCVKTWVIEICDDQITSDCSGGRNEKYFCKFFKPYRLRVSTKQPGSSE